MLRYLCGRYKARLTLKYLLFIFLSFSAVADIEYENVTPFNQIQLIKAIGKGIPIYSGSYDTGDVLSIGAELVTKIKQHGNIFSVCTGPTTLYEISFKCFKSQSCRYITSGGETRARFQLKQCLITSPSS